MIEQAKSGIYSHFDVQRGLPVRMLIKYFQHLGPDKWQIKDEVRQMVQFREGNLLHDFGAIGVFDIILCRNVLTYFDSPTQTRTLNAVGSIMAPDGILMLGSGEKVSGITDKFRAADGLPELYVLSSLQGAGLARQIAV
jgi:chemotaxis protein methyltransferase CheR